MSGQETAYRTSDPAAIEAFVQYQMDVASLRQRRDDVAAEVGRPLMAQPTGFGRGVEIVGFARNEGDKTGDPVSKGLTVSSKRGSNKGIIVPDRKTGAGKEWQVKLHALASPQVDLPGMPERHLYASNSGINAAAPALWVWDGVLYAFWPCEVPEVGENWEQIPLSTYYLAKEQHAAAAVSGNEDSDA